MNNPQLLSGKSQMNLPFRLITGSRVLCISFAFMRNSFPIGFALPKVEVNN